MIEAIAVGVLVLLLDRWSKVLVRRYARQRAVTFGSILTVRHVAGVAHSYARHGVRLTLVLTWCGALVSAAVLYRTGAWFQSSGALIGLGLAFGGAAGNLSDILERRQIVDFIDLGWWPVFNLADMAIVTGLVVALWR